MGSSDESKSRRSTVEHLLLLATVASLIPNNRRIVTDAGSRYVSGNTAVYGLPYLHLLAEAPADQIVETLALELLSEEVQEISQFDDVLGPQRRVRVWRGELARQPFLVIHQDYPKKPASADPEARA